MSLHVNKAGLAAANGINLEWLRASEKQIARVTSPMAQRVNASAKQLLSTKYNRKREAEALQNIFTPAE